MTPEIPNPGRSHNSIEETAHAQVNTSAGPDHAGDSEETPSGLQTSQAENTDGTGSFSRDLELTRQELSTSPVTLPGSTTNDNGNIPILKPQALSPGTANECSSAKFIVYSPSLGSTLADWVYKQFSQGLYSSAELRVLENVIAELENTQPEFIFVGLDEDVAFWNTLKGNAEGILGSLDWWPFQSYIAPLDQDQTRISWKCVRVLPATEDELGGSAD